MGDIWSIKEQYKRQMGNLWESRGQRGLNAGGVTPSVSDQINYFNISSAGDSVDFGDLPVAMHKSGLSSATRGIFGGGFVSPAFVNVIDYVTMASTGNAADFGDLTAVARFGQASTGTSTRGIFMGGNRSPDIESTVVDYITIPSLGNAADFGDLTDGAYVGATIGNHIRGLHGGGYRGGASTIIDYVTIATTGNAIDFGDTTAQYNAFGVGSHTRGVFAGGRNPISNTMEYIQFATLGNDVEFGDLTLARGYASGTSNEKRGVFIAGQAPGLSNVIDYITIAALGNAVDFGDCAVSAGYTGSCSQGHGGIEEGEPRPRPIHGQRGFATGGNTDTKINTIQYVHIPTLGNMVDFGDRSSTASGGHAALGSATRACMAGSWGGPSPGYMDNIDVIEMAHHGNTSDFGNLSQTRGDLGGGGNATRGVFFGGYSATPSAAKLNIMEYITISTIGNVTDFGDLSAVRDGTPCGTSSPTRLVIEGGNE